jgi:hypothetical protein
MKQGELVVPRAAHGASHAPITTASASDESAPVDPATVRRLGVARALQLGNHLHVPVIVDHTGWLNRGVEIIYRRELGGSIHPCEVRVGRDANDDDVLADGGAPGICRKYNEAIEKLRQLAIRLAAIAGAVGVDVVGDSHLDAAQRELFELDALIASRQLHHMGSGVVRLDRLRSEIAFFEQRHAWLRPIVIAAEQAAFPSWDADTTELERDE